MLQRIETLTEAEQALVDAAESLPQSGERSRAISQLRDHGLPTRKVEAWHYTDLRTRFGQFDSVLARAGAAEAKKWLGADRPLVEGARLPFLNGYLLEDDAASLPEGMAIGEVPAAHFRDSHDAVALVTTMFGQNGVSLSVPENTAIDTPVDLVHGSTGSGIAAQRHEIRLGKGASATFIERHSSGNGETLAVGQLTDLVVEEGARGVYVILQEEGDATTHLAQLNVTLAGDAELVLLVLNAGGKLVRREINVVSKGENSHLDMRGVNLLAGESHLDVTTNLVSKAPNTVSTETFRNVATDRGNGVFQGQISVEQAAQKTDARMACNTLLLSDDAGFSAKPELEIFADDVQCAHGATVTDIEDDHLFYLRARGISEREARAMLVKAFVEEVFDEIGNDTLRDALNGRIEEWLENHG